MDILKLDIEQTESYALTDREKRFQVAFLAALAATVAGFILRFVFDAPLMPEMLAQFIFAVSPIWAVEIAVGFLGPFAKHLAFLACVVLYVTALAAVAFAFLRYYGGQGTAMARRLAIALLSIILWVITMAVLIPLFGAGLFGKYLRQGSIYSSVSLLTVYAVYGLSLALLPKLYLESLNLSRDKNTFLNRRRVIRGIGYAVLLVGVYDIGRSLIETWFLKGSGRVKQGDGVFPNINGLAVEITPNEDFYVVSKNAFDPEVDTQRWRLEVTGMVENSFSLTFDEIKAMPSVEQYATLACISNEVGGDLIGNALWKGVRVRDLLERAGLQPGVVDIKMRARDDYTDSIPLDRALADGTILVYEMNDQPLATKHGFPLRLIVPGIYGMKNVKWITRLEAVGQDFRGYWQTRGWDDRAEYKTMSRIDAPDDDVRSQAIIAGIAFAGDRGVSKVEVSTDGGKSWNEAELKPPLSPYTWVLWHRDWTPERAGKYAVVVRATDGLGNTQTAQYAPPAPSGSTGYDREIVVVRDA